MGLVTAGSCGATSSTHPDHLRRVRRHHADRDMVTQSLMAGPMVALYIASIGWRGCWEARRHAEE